MAAPWSVTDVEQESRTLIVRQTHTSRVRKKFGAAHRSGAFWQLADTFPSTPRFDRHGQGRSPRPSSASSDPGGRDGKNPRGIRKETISDFRKTEQKGRKRWQKENDEKKGLPGIGSPRSGDEAEKIGGKPTFTSLLRAAIASAQRAADEVDKYEISGAQQNSGAHQLSRSATSLHGDAKERPAGSMAGQHFLTLQGHMLGKTPKRGNPSGTQWANRQFYDSGLGLGPRLPSFETPGPGPGGYRKSLQNDFGSIAVWREDAVSQVTKQPCCPFHSTIANRFGCRRGDEKEQREREAAPGPGYYKYQSFVDEMFAKRGPHAKPKNRVLTLPNSWCSIP